MWHKLVSGRRYTGQAAGYCFVNFISDNAALTAMHKLNGKLINNSNPVSSATSWIVGQTSRVGIIY